MPFTVAAIWGTSSLADTDQRHRAVFSGIWEVGNGFQVSGLHYFGAGIRSATELRRRPAQRRRGRFSARLRPDGTIVPRNSFIQPAQNKTDIRVQQRIPLGGRVAIDLIAEVFNVFNGELHDRHAGKQRELSAALDRPISHGAVRFPVDVLGSTRPRRDEGRAIAPSSHHLSLPVPPR